MADTILGQVTFLSRDRVPAGWSSWRDSN